MPTLLLLALSTLISEDLACIAAGVAVSQGQIGLWEASAACATGIVAGDLLLFLTGRWVGRPVLQRFGISLKAIDQASAWLRNRGLIVIFLSRFTPGLRLPTYLAAGMLRTHFGTFSAYFVLAAIVWTPLLVGGAAYSGTRLSILGVFGLYLLITLARMLFNYTTRRRLTGFLQRKLRWEFWPTWAVYAPLVPYLIYLSIRHRSLTLFTATNPGIPASGLVGESKAAILHAAKASAASYRLIRSTLDLEAKLALTREYGFPVVLKPDIGERGRDVLIARDDEQVKAYLERAAGDVIVQEYVPGEEAGIFYYRYPGEAKGRIFSIVEKRFPEVVGDGKRTVEELILADSRAVCLAATYRRPSNPVPAAGERVPLVEIGSHCRGALFLDGRRLRTPALEQAIDRISLAIPGFYLGRYDIRAASLEALKEGTGFKVIELNGVSAEPAHIYDPAVSLRDAYRAMAHQWRVAFEIGAMNRAAGMQPMTLMELARWIWPQAFAFLSSFAQVSRSCTVRLNTGFPGVESGSTQKYPTRSN